VRPQIRWGLGVIARDRKLAANRKMVANFLAIPNANERFFGPRAPVVASEI
jgi:hypothetical protein